MGYSAVDVAKYIVSKCTNDECPICLMQLQAILYYIQTKFLRNYKTELFVDDFEAWCFGPIVPAVYYEYSTFGVNDLNICYDDYNNILNIEKEYKIIVDIIIEHYRNLDYYYLSEELQEEGTLWDIIYNNGKGSHCVIPKKLIMNREYRA